MKGRTLLLSAFFAGMILSGCERREPSQDSPDIYDPDVDPHPGILDSGSNPSLMGDQAAISSWIERSEPVAAPAGAAPAGAAPSPDSALAPRGAGGGAIDQVKQMLSSVMAAVKAGQEEKILELFTNRDAAMLRPIILGSKEIAARTRDFEKLVRDKLGMKLPDEMRAGLADRTGGIAGGDLAKISISEMTFEQDGQNVIVTDPNGRKNTFVPVGSDYKLQMPPEIAGFIRFFSDVISAQRIFLNQMTAGIDNGTITAANFRDKAREIGGRTVMPAMTRLMEKMFSATESGAPRPAPGPGAGGQPRLRGTLRRMVNPLEGAEKAGN